jgi:hypothetical protein
MPTNNTFDLWQHVMTTDLNGPVLMCAYER